MAIQVAAGGQADNRACPAKPGQAAARDPVAHAMTSMLRPISLAGPMLGTLLFALAPGPAPAVPADQSFREGLSAYNSGDFGKAMKIWMPLVRREDPLRPGDRHLKNPP